MWSDDLMLKIAFVPAELPTSGALVLLLAEGAEPAGVAQAADAATGGAILRALAAAEFKGRKGQSVTILAPGAGLSRVVVVGLGKAEDMQPRLVEEAAGTAASMLTREAEAALDAGALSAELAAAAALGATLRAWRFDRYRTKEKADDKPKLATLNVLAADPGAAEAAWQPLAATAHGVFLTRELVSEPPNVLTPAEMARRCEPLGALGLEVEVIGPAEMKALGFGALLGVAQGSVEEPRMVVMRWPGQSGAGQKLQNPVAFIGKGVTFDTGGISIKPAAGMEDMKWDMGGAGTVIGLMAALAGRGAKVDAVGLVGLVENMPSGSAQRPGDVVTSYSGQTIEVLNTDAEGRLVLADVVWYCQERYEPRFMIDLATLTGAMIVALGHEHAGLFASDDTLAQQIIAAGIETGEKVWRMPLGEEYDKQLKSDIADMKNITGRPGSSITAAHFIQRFTNGKVWAHLDIAGTAWSSKDAPTVPKGATAWGVRLLDRLVARHFEGGASATK
jgi:leucyl aminopeptidase